LPSDLRDAISAYDNSLNNRPSSLPTGDIFWEQNTMSLNLSSRAGPYANMDFRDLAGLISTGDAEFNPISVFEKQPWMDNFVPKSMGNYVGDWNNLTNGSIYTLNNRGYAIAVAADFQTVPVVWANFDTIWSLSYQFDTPNSGVDIYIRQLGIRWNGGLVR